MVREIEEGSREREGAVRERERLCVREIEKREREDHL